MSLKHKRTRITVGAVVTILALGAVAAFAYWTSSGEGSSTVKASSGGKEFEVSGSAEGLYPGTTVAGTVTVKNADPSQPERLTKLVTTIEKTSVSGCETSWFEITSGGEQEPKVELLHGEEKTYTVNVKMKNEEHTNQNACKGATVTLHAVAS